MTTTLNFCIIIIKNNHAESKKIAVKVFGERARTEETDVKKQIAVLYTEYMPIINALDDIVTRNIKKIVNNKPGQPSTVESLGVANYHRVPTRTYHSQPQPP